MSYSKSHESRTTIEIPLYLEPVLFFVKDFLFGKKNPNLQIYKKKKKKERKKKNKETKE